MSLALLALTQLVTLAAGPDLAEIEKAVGKCDGQVMTRTFADEPQRRRSAVIAFFDVQQEIVIARSNLAQRRLEAMSPAVSSTGSSASSLTSTTAHSATAGTNALNFNVEEQALRDRQQSLDDARMLSTMRDSAMDMMRQHYLMTCNSALASAAK